MKEKLISVVMVTYNSARVLDSSLAEISELENVEFVVVDNNSADDTLQVVNGLMPSAVVVSSDTNDGFAVAVNKGVELSTGELILLLNPDTVVRPADIERLLETLDNPAVGVVGPRIEHPHGRLTIMSAGLMPTTWRMLCHYSGISRVAKPHGLFEGHYLLLSKTNEPARDVEWVTGACLGVRRADWDKVGGLTERWFMYGEDIEFCCRIRKVGLRVVLRNDCKIVHKIGGSDASEMMSKNPAWVLNLYELNLSEFSKNRIDAVAWGLVVGLGLASRAVAYYLKSLTPVKQATTRKNWRNESERFWIFSMATWTKMLSICTSKERVS